MPKTRRTVTTVAVAALVPAGFAAYAATTATAAPSHVVDRPAAALKAATANGVFRPAYPPPPPATSAPPTTSPTPTATATSTATATTTTTATTTPTATATVTATATATETSTPKGPVFVPVGTGDGQTHKGGHVKVHVHKHAFKHGSSVKIVIHGPHGFKKTIHVTVGGKGGVTHKVHIPKHAPKGHYDVTVKGHKHGHKVKGSSGFHVGK